MKTNINICFFGAYDRNFTSNKIILRGLIENGAHVVEVNLHTPLTRLDQQGDMTVLKLIGRVLKKRKIIKEVIHHWKDLRGCEFIYIGFPGHFDVILAYPIKVLLRKKIVFNPLVVFYTGFVKDQGFIKEGSLFANIIKFGEKQIYKMSDLIIADTKLQEKHIHELFGVPYSKMRTVAIGADNSVYKYSPKVKKSEDFNVVYYGLYTPLHGIEYILDAAEFCKKDKEIKFLMVGKGNTYEFCVNEAKKRKLTNIVFYPNMTEVDAFETLASADIFLGFLQKHPSVDRIIPNKVYQGLALGKAVITADAPVMRSVFTHKENIYLCAQADGKSLADGILELKENPQLLVSIAENGHRKFNATFTPKSIGRNLIKHMRAFSQDSKEYAYAYKTSL